MPPLVIELQRSLDLWERSWPDLPLAGLQLHAGERSEALATLMRGVLGLEVAVLDPARLFTGLERTSAAERSALLPLLGALLRDPEVTA